MDAPHAWYGDVPGYKYYAHRPEEHGAGYYSLKHLSRVAGEKKRAKEAERRAAEDRRLVQE